MRNTRYRVCILHHHQHLSACAGLTLLAPFKVRLSIKGDRCSRIGRTREELWMKSDQFQRRIRQACLLIFFCYSAVHCTSICTFNSIINNNMTCFAINSQSPVYDNEDIKNDHGDFAASRATEPLSTFTGMLNETHLPPFIQQTPKHRPPTTYQLIQTHINLLNHQKFPRNVMV